MLASEQARRGWDVHLALRRGGPYEALVDPRVTIHWLGDHGSAHPRLVVWVTKLIRALDPDVVQTWLPQMDLVAGSVARTLRVPWVMTERASRTAYPWRLGMLRSIAARGASRIVANSRAGAAMWRDAEAIDNAVDVAGVCAARPLPASQVLWVGRLVRQKAPDIMVAASEGFAVRMVGDGPWRDRVRAEPFRADWWGYLHTAEVFRAPVVAKGSPTRCSKRWRHSAHWS